MGKDFSTQKVGLSTPSKIELSTTKIKDMEAKKERQESNTQDLKDRILKLYREDIYGKNPTKGISITLDEELLHAIKSCAFVLDSYLTVEQVISNLVYQTLIEIQETVEPAIKKSLKQNPYKKLNR